MEKEVDQISWCRCNRKASFGEQSPHQAVNPAELRSGTAESLSPCPTSTGLSYRRCSHSVWTVCILPWNKM